MNLLGLVPKLTKTDKVAIAWAVRNGPIVDAPFKLCRFPSYLDAARSQELYFLDAEDVLVRIRMSYAACVCGGYVCSVAINRRLIKKLENHIKTCNETRPG